MPRDLSTLAGETTLNSTPEFVPRGNDACRGSVALVEQDLLASNAADEMDSRLGELRPYTQTLSISHLESCVRVEEAAFPPQERASREKIEYRLKACAELLMGVFTSQGDSGLVTADAALPVQFDAPKRKAIMMGYICATKTTNPVVADMDMAFPSGENPDPKLGHKEHGRTVCVHSLAILPEFQRRGLGKMLLRSYVQRLEQVNAADRVALIAHDHLISYYGKLGFENKGKSEAQFGGGGWYDMVLEFKSP